MPDRWNFFLLLSITVYPTRFCRAAIFSSYVFIYIYIYGHAHRRRQDSTPVCNRFIYFIRYLIHTDSLSLRLIPR